jgi:hypothetical protein
MRYDSFSTFVLNEFGDRPYPYRITYDRHDYLAAVFTPPQADDAEPFHYEVSMVVTQWHPRRPDSPLPSLPEAWEFGFGLVRPRNTTHSTVGATLRNDGYHYDTLVGDIPPSMSLSVFSTVGAIFQDFVRRSRAGRIIFSAKGDSRQRLYRRLVTRITTQMPAYRGREVSPGHYEVIRRPHR